VYLLRVVLAAIHGHPVCPNANIPTIEFPAADAPSEPPEADVVDETVHPEYVYFFLKEAHPPSAKIPNEQLPTAAPKLTLQTRDVEATLVFPEYVYLFV
jgi:hypothetical protein